MRLETADERDDEAPLDPLSDLLFGLIAIIIPAVAIMLPLIQMAANSLPSRDAQAATAFLNTALTIGGAPVATFSAGRDGVRIRDDGNRLVPINRMLDDRPLATVLAQSKQSGQPLLLLIEPDGHEAAFLFEALAAAHGPARLFQVRIDPACGFVRNPELAAHCAASTAGVRS